MTAPPFVFSHKTREITREGRVLPLCKLHAEIFACLCLASEESPAGAGTIVRATGMRITDVHGEVRYLARRLRLVSIKVAASPRGRWLIFEEVPKWKPNIPPPAILPNERRS